MKIEEMKQGTRVHMVGICGVSMAQLAEVFHNRGMIVTGSDGNDSPTAKKLQGLGISVQIGHNADWVAGADCLVRTAAVREDNPEIAEARRLGLPVFERAEGWGAIMRGYENALCVAGTHGKTTTTAMSAEIFLEAERDPTLMLGGTLPRIGAGHRMGAGDTIIVESCEYSNSFHHFFPTVAILLNVEEDHLDFFENLDEIKDSFRKFVERVPESGMIFVCGEDDNAVDTVQGLAHLRYAVDSGDIYAKNLCWEGGFPRFTLMYQGEEQGEIALRVPGRHNVLNALAAAGAALFLGVPFEKVAAGLGKFVGAGRRFQEKGMYRGAKVMDDYAHHPTELKALFSAVETLPYERVICVFQPHTFTRTKAFFHEFAEELSKADLLLLMDIYAAREPDTGEVSSLMLSKEIPHSCYTANEEATLAKLKTLAQEGDLILTVGAGDVYRIGERLVADGKK